MRVVQSTAAALKYAAGRPWIALALFGCKNRPAYRIVVFPDRAYGRRYEGSIVEELGAFDPLPNFRNEKLVACDIGRLKYWIGERNASISPPVLELLGLWGVLPIHPKTFISARHRREELRENSSKSAQRERAETNSNKEGTQQWIKNKHLYTAVNQEQASVPDTASISAEEYKFSEKSEEILKVKAEPENKTFRAETEQKILNNFESETKVRKNEGANIVSEKDE